MHNRINWLGIRTLYTKEVMRFLKVYNQTVIAPIVNVVLLLAIFTLAVGHEVETIEGVPFQVFMTSGLIMMTIVQQAFANTSSTLIMGKVLGTMIDYLLPPITPGEMLFCLVASGITRGIIVGIMTALSVAPFIDIGVHDWGLLIFYVVAASTMLSVLGVIAGILSDSFDQMAAITSYVITPLSFLSGTFYSVKQLPEFWYHVSHYNPFFYMIDGFRYSMTGYSDGSIQAGIITLIACIISLLAFTQFLLTRGYKIKT